MNWLKLEVKLLFSGIAAKICLAIVLVCAVVAIHLGDISYRQIQTEQTTSKALFAAQMGEFKQQSELPSAGDLGYYAFSPTDWQLNPWSALFIGQSQSAYSAMPVRALALQGQIYNREIVNPSWQKAGRLDLGFVLIYLLPMMLGILSVTTLSEERQANRWRMLSAMDHGGAKLIWRRLALTTLTVLLLGWAIIMFAAVWLALPLDTRLIWLMSALLVYLLFWSMVIAVIISFAKSSVFNTLSFMSVWLLLCVLVPASIGLYLHHQYSDHPALHATLEQRMMMNDGWDKDRQTTFNAFSEQYPEYRTFALPPTSGSWPWYYAQQHMSDEAVAEYWQAYLQQQQQRQNSLATLRYLSPSLTFQLAVNHLAQSSGQQHFAYIQQVADHHKGIREYLYGYLYSDKPINQTALDNYPKFTPSVGDNDLPFGQLLTILLLLGLAGYAVYLNVRKLPMV